MNVKKILVSMMASVPRPDQANIIVNAGRILLAKTAKLVNKLIVKENLRKTVDYFVPYIYFKFSETNAQTIVATIPLAKLLIKILNVFAVLGSSEVNVKSM